MDKKEYYCNYVCEKGKKQREKLIWACESVFDAVSDMQSYINECYQTCPFKKEIESCEIPEKFIKFIR